MSNCVLKADVAPLVLQEAPAKHEVFPKIPSPPGMGKLNFSVPSCSASDLAEANLGEFTNLEQGEALLSVLTAMALREKGGNPAQGLSSSFGLSVLRVMLRVLDKHQVPMKTRESVSQFVRNGDLPAAKAKLEELPAEKVKDAMSFFEALEKIVKLKL